MEPTLITRKEAAARAGVHIRTVDYWRRSGRLKTHRNALGRVSVSMEELDALIAPHPSQGRQNGGSNLDSGTSGAGRAN